MHYVSTRDSSRRLTASQAIVEGLSRDGGLYLPESIPQLTLADIRALARLSYPERAAKIMKLYLEEFSEEELLGFAQKAYGPAKFDTPAAAPVVQLADNTYIQELWHGPTCAFKDMALQMLPYLLTASLKKTGEEKTVCILVATSGDTGKAAMEGFCNVPGTKIVVFYPYGGVSAVQQAQMATQEGDKVDFVVPTGNFGDILAGYFAKEMGLPVGRLVCASNANNVLTEFLRTGRYDRRRPFYKTASPSMDILVSSNLERLLYLLSGDDALVAQLMQQLNEEGAYEVPEDLLAKLRALFWAGCCDDAGAKAAIGKVWREHHYLCDTHTAVAWDVAQQYKKENADHNAVVVLSTASPYKFPAAVLEGIGEKAEGDEFDVMEQLHDVTGVPVPKNLAGLRSREVRHRDVIEQGDMLAYVLKRAEKED